MFNKGKDIEIISETKGNICGGTDAVRYKNAPKKIISEDMCFFSVTSALNSFIPLSERNGKPESMRYISAFALPYKNGTFLFLQTVAGFQKYKEKNGEWVLIKENVFPLFVKLVNDCNLAENNGFHSRTHGLPQNFGGEINIVYKSGEKISISDNGTPLISTETAQKIAKLFKTAVNKEKFELPCADEITEIHFAENRSDGGFVKATLSVNPDGGKLKKSLKFGDGEIFDSEKEMEKEKVSAIKKTVETCGILAWENFPDKEYKCGSEKSLTFNFTDGREITVTNGKLVPDQIEGAFFDIELLLTN